MISPQASPTHACVPKRPVRRNSLPSLGYLTAVRANPTAHCTGAPTSPHAPPVSSCSVLPLRSFMPQPCCEPLFNRACVAFAGAAASWKTHCPPRRKPAARNVPQCLCFWQLPQSSLVAPEFCPLCRQSCRSSANWIPRGHSFWQISQTSPCKEHILILCKAVLPAQQSLVFGGSLRAKI